MKIKYIILAIIAAITGALLVNHSAESISVKIKNDPDTFRYIDIDGQEGYAMDCDSLYYMSCEFEGGGRILVKRYDRVKP